MWKEYSSSDLRNTISYLGDYLKNIDLICLDGEYSLLYTILTYQTGEEIYYEGKQPVTVEVLKQKVWRKRTNYKTINNRFLYSYPQRFL